MFVTAVCILFLLKLKWPKNKSLYPLYFTSRPRKGDSVRKNFPHNYDMNLTKTGTIIMLRSDMDALRTHVVAIHRDRSGSDARFSKAAETIRAIFVELYLNTEKCTRLKLLV